MSSETSEGGAPSSRLQELVDLEVAFREREAAIREREKAVAEREAMSRLMDRALGDRASELEQLAVTLAERRTRVHRREDRAQRRDDARPRVEGVPAAPAPREVAPRRSNEKAAAAAPAEQEPDEKAQAASRREDAFLSVLAHELRNLLAPIRTAVELVARLDGKPVPAPILDVVRRQVQHMVRLVDDLLDVSRLTQGKLTLQRRPTAVTEFVQHAVDASRELIAARQQRLTLDVAAAPLFVNGDPLRLVQIFSNLLQNAARYTQEGGAIRISAQRRGDSVELRVRDNGSGISAQALPHVFDLFAQDKRGVSRAQGGIGIGLAVVRRMVELHGGSVAAQSSGRGQGSEFIVTLPCVDRGEEPAIVTRPVALAPIPARILIVEDNVDAGETFAELLRLSGHDVDLALDGSSGIELFERMRPQIVLCDIGLPGMDGYEVVTRMRASGHDPRPTLIAISGYGGAKASEPALAAGFDHYVVKPANPEALLRLIDSALRVEEWAVSGRGALSGPGSLRETERREQRG